ncbi:MAG TPA: amino acid adenylation domain-containing protein [Thermoanaerobaculia bacterium]|nr:amino acid adenylation domain-containing protein [Thermoanaerobaculia bacterium]
MSVADRLAALTPEQRALFEALRQKQRQAAAPLTPPPVERVSGPLGVGDWPLTFDQERLWFLHQLAPESTASNLITAARLKGELEVGVLMAAVQGVIRRHGSWRTTFPVVEGRPVQRVAAEPRARIPVVDLSALPAAVREGTALAFAAAEVRRPFCLEHGPLARVLLARTGEREHLCFLTAHHIVSDMVSFQIFWQELAAHAAIHAGRLAPLPALPVQFADFAVWQRRWMDGEVLARELDWWRGRLDGFPQVLELPTDRPRPAEQTARGGRCQVALDAAALRALSRREGVTPFMAVAALSAALFHRLSGQDRLITGTLNANRGRPEVEPLIGFFLTQLPLPVDLSGDPTCHELLARVREAAVAAFAHQHLPFGKLVEALQPERDTSRMPLVQTLVQLLTLPGGGQGPAAEQVEGLDIYDGNARYDLMLVLFEQEGSIAGPLEYNADLFDRATAVRMGEVLAAMLAAATADPELRLSELPAFSAAARHQVLVEWNDTACPEHPALVLDLFAAQVARAPEATAWAGEGWSLSYTDLDARSNRLARHLRRRGIGPGDRVGLCLERTAELPVALLGVLKAGAAYLPLDLAHPEERRAFMLEDSRAATVLTRESLDADRPEIAREAASPLPPIAGPDDLAYVIYTSGSTGRPKGVEIPHRALGNFVRAMRRLYRVDPGDAMPAITTAAFDLSVPELYLPMLGGGMTPLLSRETAGDGVLLARALAGTRASVLQATPATYRMLLESGWAGDPGLLMLCGAEAMSRDLAGRLLPLGQGLWNFYGPTETTVWSTAWRVEPDRPIAIGRPIAETRVYLLDRRLAPVPLGAAGELCIGGLGVARGYLRRPRLTAERFVPDPFAGSPGERLYRTGDLARLRADGLLDALGRIDHQVKLRGFRIELGEIEDALRRHPAVGEAVVLLHEDRAGDPRLTAYLALAPGAEPAAVTELRRSLAERLPDYMIPAAFVPLTALPRNANGKVDRKALAVIRPAGAGAAGGPRVPPRTPVEELLAGIWSQVLEVPAVGVHDDFFALGGHSLLATQLVLRVRDAFGVEIPLRAVFQVPTLAAQAELIGRARSGEASPPGARPIRPAPRDGDLPLSFAQERLWFLAQLTPGSAAYNIPAALEIHGRLDAAALERAFAEVARRHETLRTTFASRGGRPVQVIAPPAGWKLPVIDLSALPPAEREAARRTEEEIVRPFDLARGPLLRTLLLRLGPGEHVLILTLHHVVADLWAAGVLIREVAAIYAGGDLPAPPVQYADFAVWQREWLDGAELERQLAFWRRELEGAPPVLELPADRPRPSIESFRGASLPVALGGELTAGLAALGRLRGATPFMTLTAALALLLSRWAGQDDVVLGAPIANRQRPELEGLIGMFVNTLALRVRLAGAGGFTDLLAGVRRAALDAFEHQDLPFERLVEEIQTRRDLSRHPLFQAVLAFQNVRLGAVEVPGLALEPLELASATTKFDLTFTLAEGEEGLAGRVEYASDLFDAATIERLAGHLRNLLAGIVALPAAPLADLPLLGEEERSQLLAWSGAAPVHPRAATIPGLFAEQAARTPDAVAVVCGDTELTYAALAARALAVASRLLRLGVAPESRIALVAERSPALIAGLLGILQAGCAYLPLDSELPLERLRLLLAGAGAGILLGELPAGLHLDGIRIVTLDEEEGGGAVALPAVAADQLAYVMYTSGSTGRPKGVMVTHGNVVRLVRGADWADLGPGETFLQFGNLAFDAATLEIWAPLLNGGRLALYPGRRAALDELAAAIAHHGVTTLWLTAGLFHQMVADRLEALRPLRQLLAGGDVLSPAHVRRVLAALPGCTVINGYGPTENTTFTTCHPMTSPAGLDATVPIGRPVRGTRVHVLDAALQPVPVGVWGELFAGGYGVARGYLGAPELTAESFVPDPFASEPGGRLYRTGDLVRWRPGGVLEFQGRRDGQVKIRGFRVELGEIEAALARHSQVREAVVLPWESSSGDRRLAAYVVTDAGTDIVTDVAGLRRHLAASLPEAMIPAAFVLLERLPLTANGKVDRRALPDPDPAAARTKEYLAPATAIEESLAAACAEVLGLERVGMRDNFFELGGHSLLAVQLTSRLRDRYGLEVPLQMVFEVPDLLELANRLVVQVLAEVGDLSLEDLRALLAGEPPADGTDGVV